MDFAIAFYLNYFESHYEMVSSYFLKLDDRSRKLTHEEELSKQEVIAQEIINDINDLKVKKFLETYLSSYVDQLIMEGRLLNTVNPFESKKDYILNDSMSFYPQNADDECIFHLFDLLIFMFRYINLYELPDELYTNYQNCIFDFIPIISTIYKVIPGIFLCDWNRWTICLFEISREYNSTVFETLIDTFLEIIQMRISDDFLFNINCYQMFSILSIDFDRFSGPKEIIRDINRSSISSYVQILFLYTKKGPIKDEDLFFSTIKYSNLDSTIEWFNIIIKNIRDKEIKRNISRATLAYLGNVSTEPKFIEYVLDIFRYARFYDEDYEDLNRKGIIPYFFKLFIETPDLQKSIVHTKIFNFCDYIGKYIIDNDSLIEEALNILIKTYDTFIIKLFSIVLNCGSKEKYQRFCKPIAEDIISKSMEIIPEMTNEQIIKQIILVSPFLTVKFNGNETMFNILKASLDYINKLDQSQTNLFDIEEYNDNIQFDPLLQSKVNIVYALTYSFGFAAIDEFLGLINYFLNGDYGMCIEVLNIISNIIGFLVEHIGDENFTSKIITTNETIFKIINILIENTPKKLINFNLQKYLEIQDQIQPRRKMYSYQSNKFSDQYFILKFALYPLVYETKASTVDRRFNDDDDQEENSTIHSCLYSFRMNGQKIDDTYGYYINDKPNNKPDFKYKSIFTVNLFIRNITNYVINMLKIFGIKPETITLFKQILMISVKNGLIQVSALEEFLHFVSDNHDFFTNDDEFNYWISGLIERSIKLMKFSSQSEEDKLEIGDKKEHLRVIFLFFYNMNHKIFPGCLTK